MWQAAAISHSAMMISFALLIGNATYKSSELLSFGTWFVLGGVAQLFMRHVLDKLLLWGQNLDRLIDEDNNWGAALIVGSVQISVAQVCSPCTKDRIIPRMNVLPCILYQRLQMRLDGYFCAVHAVVDMPRSVCLTSGRPMSCMPGYFEVINPIL